MEPVKIYIDPDLSSITPSPSERSQHSVTLQHPTEARLHFTLHSPVQVPPSLQVQDQGQLTGRPLSCLGISSRVLTWPVVSAAASACPNDWAAASPAAPRGTDAELKMLPALLPGPVQTASTVARRRYHLATPTRRVTWYVLRPPRPRPASHVIGPDCRRRWE